jgi:hypothetical protein
MAKKKRKASRKRKSSRKNASAALTRKALSLIDQAAALMKVGVIAGAKQGAKTKVIAKKKAYSLADAAIRQLNRAVLKGGKAIRKGIKRI